MTEKPILFSAPMVNAILGGRKTMTRRVIFKDDPDDHCPWRTGNGWQDGDLSLVCPYVIGDTLWVRETFAVNCVGGQDFLFYRADSYPDGDGVKWKPSIFMPRKHSRITLRITDVRAERLQEIDEGDAIAEGVEQYQRSYGTAYLDYRGDPGAFFINARISFSTLWDSINARRGYRWKDNPWVWVVSFERV